VSTQNASPTTYTHDALGLLTEKHHKQQYEEN